MPNYNKQLDKLKGLSKAISGVKGSLVALGIMSEDPCSVALTPSKLSEDLKTFTEDLGKKTLFTFNYIISLFGMDSIANLAGLLAILTGGVFANVLGVVLGEILFGSVVGIILSCVTLIVLALPGIAIILQYLLLKNLLKYLYYRDTLIKILYDEVDSFLTVMLEYQKLFSKTNGTSNDYDNLKKAVTELTSAKKILNNEATKPYINKDQIIVAEEHIDAALSLISSGTYEVIVKKVNLILKLYNMKTRLPNAIIIKSAGIVGWIHFFDKLYKELTSSTYVSEEERKRIIIEIVSKLMPAVPSILRLLMLQKVIINNTKVIMDKFPASAGFGLEDLVNKYQLKFADELEKMMKYTGNSMATFYDPEFFRNPETKDLTLQDISSIIAFYEGSLKIFPSMFNELLKSKSFYSSFLSDSALAIGKVKDEIEEDIKGNVDGLKLSGHKLGWMIKLSTAKSLLKTVTGSYAGINLSGEKEFDNLKTVSGADVEQFVKTSTEKIEEFKAFLDDSNNLTFNKVSKVIFLAQSAFLPLSLNLIVLLSSEGLRSLVGKLQGIKIALEKIRVINQSEITEVNKVVSYISGHKVFSTIMSAFEAMLSKLKGVPMTTDLASGDISSLTAVAKGVTDGIEVFSCFKLGDAITSFLAAGSLPTADASEVAEKAKKIEESRKDLETQELQLTVLTTTIKEATSA